MEEMKQNNPFITSKIRPNLMEILPIHEKKGELYTVWQQQKKHLITNWKGICQSE